MIRLLMEIEKRDGAIHTTVMTVGIQQGLRVEMEHAKMIVGAIEAVLGECLESTEYLKDLPPKGGNKQQT